MTTRSVVVMAVVTALAASTSGGCSLLAVRGPARSSKPRVDVACTDEKYAPALDVLSSARGVVAALDSGYDGALRIGAMISAAIFLGSSVYGYVTTNECAVAKNEAYRLHARLLGRQAALLQEISDNSQRDDGDDDDENDDDGTTGGRAGRRPGGRPAPMPARPAEARPPASDVEPPAPGSPAPIGDDREP